MHKVINQSLFFSIIWMFIVSLLWFFPLTLEQEQGDITFYLLNQYPLFTIHKIWSSILQFALLLIIAYIFQRLSIKRSIIPVKTFLPFILLIFFVTLNDNLHYFNVESVAFILFLCALFELFLLFHQENSIGHIFNLSFFLGLATLLVPGYLFLYPIFIFGFISFNSLSARTLIASLIGFSLPASIGLSLCFLLNKMPIVTSFFQQFESPLLHISFEAETIFSIAYKVILILVFLLTSIHYLQNRLVMKLQVRQQLFFLLISTFFLMIIWLFSTMSTSVEFPLMLTFTAIFSFYFAENKSRFSLIMFILFVCIGLLLYANKFTA